MPPLHSGDTGDGRGEDGDDGVDDQIEFRPPLPPDDRIWRHPSEVAAAAAPAADPPRSEPARPLRLLGVATVSALIGATLSIGVVAALGGLDRSTAVVERNVAIQPVTSRSSADDTVAAITARTAPAIAALRVMGAAASVEGVQDVPVSGSAVVIRSDGYLLTNAHLVTGARVIEVRLHGGTSTRATVVGTDPITDIAVLRVDADDLRPAAIGTADVVLVGDTAIVIGTADSGGWATEVTTGVISGLDRRLGMEDGRVLHDMILVDVPIAAASAGGPLLDAHGAVVGITSGVPATTGDDRTLGVATPIDVAMRVARQLIDHGRARHVWLGVEGADLASELALQMQIAGGAAVSRVVAGGPAETAGIRADDVVVAVGDTGVDSMSDLIAVLRMHDPEDEVTLTVRRGDQTMELIVVLAERRE